MIRLFVGLVALSTPLTNAVAADPVKIGIGYIRSAGPKQIPSLLEQPAENDGVAGVDMIRFTLYGKMNWTSFAGPAGGEI